MTRSTRRFIVSLIVALAAPLIVFVVTLPLLWAVHVWNLPGWLITAIDCAFSGALLYFTWRFAQAVVEHRFRFTIRTLLLAVAVAGVLCGTIGHWWLQLISQHLAFDGVAVHGANIGGSARAYPDPRRNALYRWIGYDPFNREQALWFSSDRAVAEALDHSEKFTTVASLNFDRNITSQAFTHSERLNQFRQVRQMQFIESKIDDDALRCLEKCTNLEGVFLNGCANLTDAGIAALAELPNLNSLALYDEGGGMSLGNQALEHVGQIETLTVLSVVNMPRMDDAGFEHLHTLSNLECLIIHRTGLTAKGLQQLYNALPNCRITTDLPVDGPQNVRCIEIRRTDKPSDPPRVVDDSARITGLLKLIKSITDQQMIDPWQTEPSPATYELNICAEKLVLYKVRLDKTTYQQTFWGNWSSWAISPEVAAELKELLELD